MLCPSCNAGCSENDLYCHTCGADLTIPSKSLVPTRKQLPAVFNKLHLPRLAASAGAVAAGVGLELLRRGLLARLAKPSQSVDRALPTLDGLRDLLTPQTNKKLPKDYEVHETIVYMRRVIRRAK